MASTAFKQQLGVAFLAVASAVLPINAVKAEDTVAAKTGKATTVKAELAAAATSKDAAPAEVAKKEKPAAKDFRNPKLADIKVPLFQKYDPTKTDLSYLSYADKISEENPMYILEAGSKKRYLYAMAYAEEIQRGMKAAFGYDVQVLVVKSDNPKACSLTPVYRRISFYDGEKSALRSPEEAYEQWISFANRCSVQDRDAKLAASVTLDND